MYFTLQPWQFYFVIFAGWVNHQQQQVIEYLRTENQVLKEKLGTKRILLNDDQRRRLAVKGKILGRKMLEEVGTLFTPDTVLRCAGPSTFAIPLAEARIPVCDGSGRYISRI